MNATAELLPTADTGSQPSSIADARADLDAVLRNVEDRFSRIFTISPDMQAKADMADALSRMVRDQIAPAMERYVTTLALRADEFIGALGPETISDLLETPIVDALSGLTDRYDDEARAFAAAASRGGSWPFGRAA